MHAELARQTAGYRSAGCLMNALAACRTSPEAWPTIWRVVAPRAGSYNHDMVFLETEDEREARRQLHALRRAGYPVRFERVECGPLPAGAKADLVALRAANPQNAGEGFPKVAGYWEHPGAVENDA